MGLDASLGTLRIGGTVPRPEPVQVLPAEVFVEPRKPRGVTITIRMPAETYEPIAEMLQTELEQIPEVESVNVELDPEPPA